MKYGYCVCMVAEDKQGIGYERIPVLQELGFDYVELPLAQIMALEDDAFREGPLKAVRAAGLPCLACNNFFPASLRLTGPEADLKSAVAYAEAAFERAALLGAENVVFGSSGARNVPAGFPLKEGLRQIASLLAQIASLAQRHGIALVIEHLNRLESNVINTLAEGVALSREVNHPHVKALADTYHMRLGGEPLSDLAEAGPLLHHLHLARTLGRTLPCPGDEEDYESMFRYLRSIRYDGCISLEAYRKNDFAAEAREALALIKSVQGSIG